MTQGTEQGLARAAISGVAWQGLGVVAVRVMRMVVFLLLARLLAPEAFGVIAIASVFTTAFWTLSSGGFSQAVIQRPTLAKADLDTAFTVALGFGVISAALLAGAAGPIAGWMSEPVLHPVLLALSAMPLLGAIGIVPEGLLNREMRFRSLTLRHLIAAIASTAVAVALAFLGAGVWALVAQTLSEAAISATALWIAARRSYRPRLGFNRASFAAMSGYGTKVVAADLIRLASTRLPDIVIGSALGVRALGLYSVAFRLMTIFRETIETVGSRVSFPLIARLGDDESRLRAGLRRTARMNFSLSAPVFLFIAGSAPQVVNVALGPQWAAAAPVATALAVAGLALVVVGLHNTFLSARGRAGRALAVTIVAASANAGAALLAVGFGLTWVGVAIAVAAFTVLPISILFVGALLGGARQVVRWYLPIGAAAVIPLAAGVAVRWASPLVGELLSLAILGTLGIGLYLVVIRFVARDCFDDILLLTGRLGRRSGTPKTEVRGGTQAERDARRET